MRYQDILNVQGALYAVTLFLGIYNSITVQPAIAIERTVFYRERSAYMYAVAPWTLAHVSLAQMCSGSGFECCCFLDLCHPPCSSVLQLGQTVDEIVLYHTQIITHMYTLDDNALSASCTMDA